MAIKNNSGRQNSNIAIKMLGTTNQHVGVQMLFCYLPAIKIKVLLGDQHVFFLFAMERPHRGGGANDFFAIPSGR